MKNNNQTMYNSLFPHFICLGKGEKKLVFLHGWGGNTESFEALAKKLLKKIKNIEIVLVDFPGFGKTGFPPKSGWGTQDYADWTHEFLLEIFPEVLPENFYFYTHSFGGRIVVRLLRKYPELSGKVILTSSAGIKWPLHFLQKISVWLSKNIPATKRFPEKWQKWVMTKVFGARDWGMVDEKLKSTLKKVLEESDFRDELPKIQNKMLILWGEKDAITPLKSGKIFAEKLPNNQFFVFKTGRHGIHRTHVAEIAEKIAEFLNEDNDLKNYISLLK